MSSAAGTQQEGGRRSTHSPAWSPDATACSLAHRASVELVVDVVLEVRAHPDHLVLVPVDPCQHANVGDYDYDEKK